MTLLKLINPDLHVRLINENTNRLHRSTMTLSQKLALVNMISVTAFISVMVPYCLPSHINLNTLYQGIGENVTKSNPCCVTLS